MQVRLNLVCFREVITYGSGNTIGSDILGRCG